MSCHVIFVMSCRAVLCRAVSYRVVLCFVMVRYNHGMYLWYINTVRAVMLKRMRK